jgi:PAS domain S-box-containing protein
MFAVTLGLFALAVAALWREHRGRRAADAEVRELNRTLETRVSEIRAELGRAEGRLRDALDSLLEGCAILDRDLRYIYVNRASAAQGRSTVEQMVGRTMFEVYPGYETTELHAAMQRTLATQSTQTIELEFTFPDGSAGWFDLHLVPVAEGIFALSVEHTELVHAERALHASEGRFRALLESLPEQVFLLDAQGVVLDLHVPDESLAPRPLSEMRARPLVDALPPQARTFVQAALDRAAKKGLAQTIQYDIEFAQGLRRFEAMVVPTDGERFTVVTRDISARQDLEAQLRQSQKMEAVGQLTGGIAHDFNNVLTIIGGNAELLSMAQPDLGGEHDELGEIMRATRRGADMIAQLLSFSRRGMLKRQHVVVGDAIRPFSTMLERLIPATIKLELGPLTSTDLVRLDTGALEQMLANLCTNARDAMPDGGSIRIDCETTWLDAGYHATHPWVVPGPYVNVSVTDTGVGMDEETRLRMFEPFYTTKPAGVGTGLGMAMVYGIMKEHDGMVHVYSEVGRGTVVNLYFPVDAATSAKSAAEPRLGIPAVRGGGETILLAEDDAAIRMATRRALERNGYVILDASDGEQALSVFRANASTIDLVISDLIMPNLGGRQFAEALRAEGSTVPVLFTSGYSSEAVYRQGEMPARVGFLHKPWTLTQLFTRVRDILDGAEVLE